MMHKAQQRRGRKVVVVVVVGGDVVHKERDYTPLVPLTASLKEAVPLTPWA